MHLKNENIMCIDCSLKIYNLEENKPCCHNQITLNLWWNKHKNMSVKYLRKYGTSPKCFVPDKINIELNNLIKQQQELLKQLEHNNECE